MKSIRNSGSFLFSLKLLDKLVEKLYNTISGEVSLLLGLRGEIKFIKSELQIMNAFLRRAEGIQDVNEAARAWVMQVREVAYDIEDCIDEVSLYLLHSEEHGFVSNLFRPKRWFGRLGDHRQLAAQIKSLKSEVEEVSKRRLRYQITELNKGSSSEYKVAEHDPRMAALFVEESQLVGIEEPKKKLLGWLLNEDDRRLSLVAVVGGGGLGKTTIVRKAYESPNVTGGFFQCRAWITVSQQHSIDELLKDMICQILPTPLVGLRKMNMAKLIEKLRKHLEDKRYVIVFDDLWTPGAWNSLELSLPKNELGSRVMITTRINKVAESCRAIIPGHIYQPEKLSDEKSFDLFCRRVFPGRACPDELGSLSRDILKKCDGLPLAIVAIAGVLSSKPKKDQRE
ncbi:uncharacterized protein A4U43_C01F5340 [Asparagus officinalis]|uniref:Uncharacterized protein n=1 Tax=Asparagus officinalis TaxID=4686 RepID=A0A5P1FPI1_ASPOF|nr:uncharacterized protein A4U43_C01F5340 [Asparagus officinalis]